MSLKDWLTRFKAQHEQARTGKLSPEGMADYRAGRDELARALLGAQAAALKSGEVPRQMLRVARAVQADLEWSVDRVRAVTQEISAGGFSALLAKAPPTDEEIKVQLRLPGVDPVSGRAKVVGSAVLPASVRVSFAFQGLGAAERDRLEFAVFDTVLQNIRVQ
ncbi:MAG TPA: PilZ domain-containing protein [Anaeromyxobacteraceae bacterium]|nr:PilZ domain-containing protein [Anaeromyxobacteraceae bacterium]